MKIADVVNQIRAVLPKYTDVFSSVVAVDSITVSAGVATVVTIAVHGMTTGASAVLRNVTTETGISAVSQDGLVFTFTTDADHDLTSGWTDHATVTLDGFTDSAWNDSFTLTDVPNRRNFKVQSTNSAPTLNGNENLLEIRADGVNGRFSATVTSTTAFTIAGSFIDGTYSGGVVSKAQRIASAINFERALEQYTEQSLNDFWMYVVMDVAEASKDRNTFSDATSTLPNGNEMRLRLLDGFSLYIMKSVTQDIAASLDTCRHDLLLPILRSLYGTRFDSGLSGSGDFRTTLLGHQAFLYNRAILAYEYSFEAVMDLTDGDTVEDLDTSAFRDIDFTESIGGTDTTDMTVEINLDDTPLP